MNLSKSFGNALRGILHIAKMQGRLTQRSDR